MGRRSSGVACGMILSIASACLAPNGAPGQGRPNDAQQAPVPAASRLPPNYRHLIAQYILARTHHVIHKAMITPPYNKYGSIFRGGTIPAVCVAIFRDNPFGIVVRDNWVLTVENGRVLNLAIGFDTCSGFSPFNELKRP